MKRRKIIIFLYWIIFINVLAILAIALNVGLTYINDPEVIVGWPDIFIMPPMIVLYIPLIILSSIVFILKTEKTSQ